MRLDIFNQSNDSSSWTGYPATLPASRNSPQSTMTPRLSAHFCLFGLVFFVLKSLLGIAKQLSREEFAILPLKPRSHIRIIEI